MQDQHIEVSRRGPNLFSVPEVAARIGAGLETVTDWVEIGAIDRAVFGGGQFSKNELLRAALVFELVKFDKCANIETFQAIQSSGFADGFAVCGFRATRAR